MCLHKSRICFGFSYRAKARDRANVVCEVAPLMAVSAVRRKPVTEQTQFARQRRSWQRLSTGAVFGERKKIRKREELLHA